MERNPVAVVLVTAMLAETAWADKGMPQLPATGKTRGLWVTIEGGPKAPLKPLPRVSAKRQGVIATKAIGGVGTAASTSATGSCASASGVKKHRSSRPPPSICRADRMDSSLDESGD